MEPSTTQLYLKRAVPAAQRDDIARGLSKRVPSMSTERCATLLSRPGVILESRHLERVAEVQAWLEGQRVRVERRPTPTKAEAAPQDKPRPRFFGLQSRLTLLMGLPLLLTALAVLLFARPQLERAFGKMLGSSATQVAYTVASTLRPDSVTGTIAQLDLVAKYDNIGFIAVQPSQDPRLYLAYRDPAFGLTWKVLHADSGAARGAPSDPVDQIWSALEANPTLQELTVRDDRAARMGANANPSVRAVYEKIKDRQTERTFSVREARVFEAENAARTVLIGSDGAPPAGTDLAFTLRLGVLDEESRLYSKQQIGLLLTLVGASLVVAVLLAAFAARSVSVPISRLIGAANQISLGELQHPVPRQGNDEIGDLALALERMRVSLQILMDRLKSRKGP